MPGGWLNPGGCMCGAAGADCSFSIISVRALADSFQGSKPETYASIYIVLLTFDRNNTERDCKSVADLMTHLDRHLCYVSWTHRCPVLTVPYVRRR